MYASATALHQRTHFFSSPRAWPTPRETSLSSVVSCRVAVVVSFDSGFYFNFSQLILDKYLYRSLMAHVDVDFQMFLGSLEDPFAGTSCCLHKH